MGCFFVCLFLESAFGIWKAHWDSIGKVHWDEERLTKTRLPYKGNFDSPKGLSWLLFLFLYYSPPTKGNFDSLKGLSWLFLPVNTSS